MAKTAKRKFNQTRKNPKLFTAPMTKTRATPVASKALTQVIKKVISKEQETKYVARDVLNNVLFNSPVVSTSELYSCLPAMEVGTLSSQRIGQKVTPRSCRIRGTIALTDDDDTADIVAYMYVLLLRSIRTILHLLQVFQ